MKSPLKTSELIDSVSHHVFCEMALVTLEPLLPKFT